MREQIGERHLQAIAFVDPQHQRSWPLALAQLHMACQLGVSRPVGLGGNCRSIVLAHNIAAQSVHQA